MATHDADIVTALRKRVVALEEGRVIRDEVGGGYHRRAERCLRFLAFSISRAWQGFWRNAAMSLAATATMTLMLLLLAGVLDRPGGLLAGLSFVEQKVEVVADLRRRRPDADIGDLRLRIAAMPEVRDVDYVSKEEALQRFRDARAAQGQDDLTAYLDDNPAATRASR